MKTVKNYLKKRGYSFAYSIAGWALAMGFVINCAVAPYIGISFVNWIFLIVALTGLTGVKNYQDCKSEDCNCDKHEYPRHWIMVIGWALCIGFANNAVVNHFYEINMIDWIELLTALAVLIGIGTDRERKLNKIKDKYTAKQMWIIFTGIVLALGFVCTCFVVPVLEYLVNETVLKINWTPVAVKDYFIVVGFLIVGGDVAYRNVFLDKAKKRSAVMMETIQSKVDEKSDDIDERKEGDE